MALAALTACTKAPKTVTLDDMLNQRLEAAKNFQDSLAAIDGCFIGGLFNSQTEVSVGPDANRSEILRGMRTVMGTDTANTDYLMGIRMGLSIFQLYKDLAQIEGFSKEDFVNTICASFRLDSVTTDDANKLRPMFDQMFTEVENRVRMRKEQEVFDTPVARENRMVNDAVAAKLQSDPAYKSVGNDGLMVKVITEGDGEVINPNSLVVVSIKELRADTRQLIRGINSTPMAAGDRRNPVLQSVVPFMSVGETAEFFVPYTLAYGILGNETIGVKPCESIIAEVTIEPYVEGDRH